jgi:hypothetical protein
VHGNDDNLAGELGSEFASGVEASSEAVTGRLLDTKVLAKLAK